MVEFITALVYDKLFEFNCLCFGLSKKNVLLVSLSFLHFFTDLHLFYITVFRYIGISLRFCEQVSTGALMITIKWWVNNRRQITLKWAMAILADQAFIIIKEWLENIPPPAPPAPPPRILKALIIFAPVHFKVKPVWRK